jgi:putative DNA primase/helicase
MTDVNVDPEQVAAFVDALFRYADGGSWVSLRGFRDDVDNEPPIDIKGVPVNGNLSSITGAATALARTCANYQFPAVFCPPIATFSDRKKATEAALKNGLALSVELDADAERGRKRLEFLFGVPATVVVASGGIYTDPKTGEAKPKLHLHWRLKEPTRDAEAHKRLKQARAMATALVGGDASNKPVVHPIRWPGSVHRKGEPKLCRIVALNPDAEIDLQDALSILLDIQPEFRKADGRGSGTAPSGDGEDRETPELVRALLAGEDLHSTLLALSMRYLKRGMAAEHVVTTLRGLVQAVPPERRDGDRPGRWQARYDDIPRMVRQAEEKLGDTGTGHGAPWPDPEPLPEGLPPVAPFPLELLPSAIRPWVEDAAERTQAPPDYIAVAVMVALGSVLGRQITIRPKRQDDWTVVPNLWGAVIGPPGVLKTPALEEALRHLRAMECEAKQAFDEETKIWTSREEVDRERKKLRAEAIKKRLKDNQDPDRIARDLAADTVEVPPPTRRRFLANDATIEKLGELLRDNPNGVLLYRDELMGWLRSLESEGREADRAFYLEAWNGTGRFTYDRIGRGTLDIDAACLGVLGGIQPGPLLTYLGSRAWEGGGADGLLQRFQVAVWPDIPRDWRNVDRWPNAAARDQAGAAFRRFASIASETSASASGLPFVRFDPDAQRAFETWRGKLEQRLRAGNIHPALEAHLAKYRSLLPALALICHLADHNVSPVNHLAICRAEAWLDYLESHARRIYDALLRSDQTAARALGEHINDLPSPFRIRDVYRPCWTGLTTKEAAQEAVDTLADLGWLRVEQPKAGKSGGRPAALYPVNPKLRNSP